MGKGARLALVAARSRAGSRVEAALALQLVAPHEKNDQAAEDRPGLGREGDVGDQADEDSQRESSECPDDDCGSDADGAQAIRGSALRLVWMNG